MSSSPLALVTWDLDGTLYDKDALAAEVRRRIARSVRPGTWRQARDAGRALRKHRAAERRVRAAGGVVDAGARALWDGPLWGGFVEAYFLPALRVVGPWPGLADRLARVRDRGLRQVVVSDFPVEAKLAALGLSDAFDGTYAGTELGLLKPHPDLFAHVLADTYTPARAVLHVGDRADTDGRAAALAGVAFAHVVRGDLVPVDVVLQHRSG